MLLLPRLLKNFVRMGRLTVITPDGRSHVFGPGPGDIRFAHGGGSLRRRRRNVRLFLNFGGGLVTLLRLVTLGWLVTL